MGQEVGLRKSKKDTLEQVAERIVLETYNEAFSKFPRGGKVSNEALTDSLVLFFRLGSEWQQEQSKNLYSEEESIQKIIDYVDFQFNTNGELNSEIKKWFEQFSKLKNG